jgi:glycosyltransferase involved in cell wall biosynthesis
MRMLVLISDRPCPPVTGTRVRNFYLWPAAERLGVELKVLGTDLNRDTEPAASFPGIDAEFYRCARAPFAARAWRVLTRSYHESPRSAELARRVDEVTASWQPDVIHAEELRMAYYLPGVRGRQVKARQSVTFHNVESDLFTTIGSPPVRFGRPLVTRVHLGSLRRYEARAVARTDVRFAYSEHDRARYAQLFPDARWSVTRNGTNALGIQPAPQPTEPKLLLVASWSYAPNRAGLAWFLEAVAPALVPSAAITVAGSGADNALRRQLADHHVRFVDTPIDLKPLYDEHAVVVVPLLEGSGTRGKILEALGHERLVVTTPKGAEGLDLRDGEGVVIASTADALAARINEALASFETRAASARRGREAVIERYDWSVVAAELRKAWDDACGSP